MKQLNLQDVFLNQARREKITVTIYLTNGFQFKGVVRGFAISTIIPSKTISILESVEGDKENE